MADTVRKLFEELREDPFRIRMPFAKDLEEASVALLRSSSNQESAGVISGWLSRFQPCLFGRIAARLQGLSYCFLSEADLNESDESIHEKIQTARRAWRRRAFSGDASGFVVLIISDRIAKALPNESVKSLAKRLCYLYLGRDDDDTVLLEDVFLRVPGKEDAEIHWKAGVNYFSAHADQRWWHDHRIPAGMAFSVNSVGHMVKSFQVARSSEEMWQELGLSKEDWANLHVDSLGKALINAMLTIDGAATAISGKATRLLDAGERSVKQLECPVALPARLKDKNFCEYFGHYHTDITIPSEYFRPDVERPCDLKGHTLDFTYLFNENIENSAFEEMGRGIRVRRRDRKARSSQTRLTSKNRRVVGEQGLISEHPELKQALDEV